MRASPPVEDGAVSLVRNLSDAHRNAQAPNWLRRALFRHRTKDERICGGFLAVGATGSRGGRGIWRGRAGSLRGLPGRLRGMPSGRPPKPPETSKAAIRTASPAEDARLRKVRPGETIVDFASGRAVRACSSLKAVGPRGAVYAVTPQVLLDRARAARSAARVRANRSRQCVHQKASRRPVVVRPA